MSQLTHDVDKDLVDDAFPNEHLIAISIQTPWIDDIENYLGTRKLPKHLSYQERCKIIIQCANYSWIKGFLFNIGPDHILRRHVREDEVSDILHACHNEPFGGNYVASKATYKALKIGSYWPTLFKYVNQYVSRCDDFQRMGKPNKKHEMPLDPKVTWEPFEKRGLYFMGPIDPPSNQNIYILTCIDYMIKWVEVKALKNANEEIAAKFLDDNIFTSYGIPREIVIDQGSQFTSNLIEILMRKHQLKHI